MARSPKEVAETHLAAVIAGEPGAMAADYAADAVLERGEEAHWGRAAIEAYFATVPDRLGPAHVVFDAVDIDGDIVTFSWHLEGAAGSVSGTDTCRIAGGMIVHQSVVLDSSDF